MLAVPLLTTLTDRIDARLILLAGSAASGLATIAFGVFADGLLSASPDLGARRHRLCRRLHAGPEGADRPAGAGRRLAQRHLVHGLLLPGRRPLVPGVAADGGASGLALCLLSHRARAAGDDRGRPWPEAGATGAAPGRAARFRSGAAQSPRHGLHPRLRRALLRALRHPHLDRCVLDLRGGPQRRLGLARRRSP